MEQTLKQVIEQDMAFGSMQFLDRKVKSIPETVTVPPETLRMIQEQYPTVNNTLEQRGNRYGDFVDNGYISQSLKSIARKGTSWEKLAPDQKESIEMILHKIARIVNGDPNYSDSWHDIAGYAQLVENRLKKYE